MFKKFAALALVCASLMFTTASAAHAQAESHAVYAELGISIDARTAKVGDHVSAKLRDSVRFKSGDRLPEGALLTGSIVSVGPSGTSFSILLNRIQFDRHEPSAISVMIRRLDDAPTNATDSPEDSKDIKTTGDPVSKLRGVVLTNTTDGSTSGVLSSRSKSLYLGYRTLLGCIVSR
jgi:hypothetical protein